MAANRQAAFQVKSRPTFFRLTAFGLSLMCITGGVWGVQALLKPPVAQAYKSRVDVNLDRLRDETYQSFIRRAEIIARAAAQRSFDRDILASEVSIMIIGQHNGTETPVLLLEVSREKWRERPDTRRWATYYRTAQALLKLPSAGPAFIPNAVQIQPANVPELLPVSPQTSAPITAPPAPNQISAPTASPAAAPQTAPQPVPRAVPQNPPKPSPASSPQASPTAPPAQP